MIEEELLQPVHIGENELSLAELLLLDFSVDKSVGHFVD